MHTHTHVHTRTHTRAHTHTRTHVHVHTHTRTHTRVHAHIHARTSLLVCPVQGAMFSPSRSEKMQKSHLKNSVLSLPTADGFPNLSHGDGWPLSTRSSGKALPFHSFLCCPNTTPVSIYGFFPLSPPLSPLSPFPFTSTGVCFARVDGCSLERLVLARVPGW
jgi:hypothetical protein